MTQVPDYENEYENYENEYENEYDQKYENYENDYEHENYVEYKYEDTRMHITMFNKLIHMFFAHLCIATARHIANIRDLESKSGVPINERSRFNFALTAKMILDTQGREFIVWILGDFVRVNNLVSIESADVDELIGFVNTNAENILSDPANETNAWFALSL
jgi:hypothetical protein